MKNCTNLLTISYYTWILCTSSRNGSLLILLSITFDWCYKTNSKIYKIADRDSIKQLVNIYFVSENRENYKPPEDENENNFCSVKKS